MVNYEESRVKLTNTQLKKLSYAAKNKTGTVLWITKKNFQEDELTHELFLTTKKRGKIRNTFAKNMLTDIKLNEAKLCKIIHSGGFLSNAMGKIGKEARMNLAVPLAKDVLPKLATKATLSILDKFERKISVWVAVRAVFLSLAVRAGFILFISNKDMDYFIRIVKSLENSGLLIDGTTETVQHEIKENKMVFFLLW